MSPILIKAGAVNVGRDAIVEIHPGWPGRLSAAAQMVDLFTQLFEPALDGPRIRMLAEAAASYCPEESKAVLAAVDAWLVLTQRCISDGP